MTGQALRSRERVGHAAFNERHAGSACLLADSGVPTICGADAPIRTTSNSSAKART
jgi:hypothetical protein